MNVRVVEARPIEGMEATPPIDAKRTRQIPLAPVSRAEAPSPLQDAEVRRYLGEIAAEQWRYYAESVNADTNHLPPDNVRVEKDRPITVDYRTSPTNIGLYMLSTVTALELGLVSEAEALDRLRKTVDTIDRLPKYDGHLYNWYSIDREPKEIGDGFISTVDNGNFVAFLLAIVTGLGDRDPKLTADLNRIIDGMRFDMLYDREKGLLYHGAHVKDGRIAFTGGHYDMIITEARCAYAAAIMLGQIPKPAWSNMKRKLGKEIDNLNVDRGLEFQSYTGTMFEYLTPRLLMKHGDSPLGRADEEAVRIQIADQAGGIWGRSEANSNTSKGYAAWGAKKLSQSREFTSTGDEIIAPYACQMAAGIAPAEVAANLRKMEEVGLRGRYGFYESCAVKKEGREYTYEVVPQFYAHHIGMGFVGMANHLFGDKVTDWFHGSAHNQGVIEELLATPSTEYKQPAGKKVREKIITNAYAYEPPVSYDKREIAGNGTFITNVRPVGASTWSSQSYALSHNESFFFRDNTTGQLLPVKLERPDAVRSKNGARSFDYTVATPDGKLAITIDISVSAANKVKISKVSVENQTGRDQDLAITGYLDWILDDINAYLNHPVYRNLYVETELDRQSGAVIARRRTMQGPDQDRQPYGFFAIAGGKQDWSDGSRTSVLGRLGSLAAPRAVIEGRSEGEFGATLDPAAALSKSVKIARGKKAEVSFLFGFAESKDQIGRIVKKEAKPSSRKSVPHYPPESTHAKMLELAGRTERDLRIKSKPIVHDEVPPEKIGRFVDGGKKFIIDDPFATKKPWSMVVSNGSFGFVATAAGWGYSFGSNSQQDRITPYVPDNTSELPLRGVLVKDRASGETFSIAPNPAPSDRGKYQVEMTPGSITYRFASEDGLRIAMSCSVASKDPVEMWRIEVENDGRARDLELSSFLKWAKDQVGYDAKSGAILARSEGSIVPGSVAFHALAGGPSRANDLLSAEKDPFSGLSMDLSVGAGEKKQLSFVLGQAKDEAAARALVKKYSSIDRVDAELAIHEEEVNRLLGGLQVKTPDPEVDTMLNGWLTYQAYYAHFLARSGYYQSGGAYGFRDQLQTAMNLLDSGNDFFKGIARDHILESARHQFEEGTVEHWWHPHNNLGQLSTISDNLLWLPLAVSHYLEVTGDRTILGEQTPFAKASRGLREGELDFCEPMGATDRTASIYEHAKRAIDLVIGERIGEHGLPLIGKGDWNDGLDRVGHLGKGESVWLGFFLYDVLTKFASVAESQKDGETAERYREAAASLKTNLKEHAWNGEYFIRAWADSGEKVDFNDAIVQAWAVLSGAADPEQAKQAVASAVKSLYQPENKTILLFDRVLDKESWGGSLAAYPNGLRENNAQYTHGSSWLPRAVAELGDGDLALDLYKCLLPTAHASDPRYGAEPYVVAADIYGGAKAGEGGWTWYSGGPGWIYRTGIEKILGVQFREDRMFIDPCIPGAWPGFEVTQGKVHVEVKNPDGVSKGVKKILVDGREIDPAKGVRLDGKEHRVEVIMGETDRSAPTRPDARSRRA